MIFSNTFDYINQDAITGVKFEFHTIIQENPGTKDFQNIENADVLLKRKMQLRIH